MIEEAVILAGGLGTRLRSVVSDVPKPMAPVSGRPFLHWLLDNLGKQGIKRIVLAVGYMADKIINDLGENYRGIDLFYSVEQKPLGTGGAIWKALELCSSNKTFVLNGDTWLNAPLAEVSSSFPNADIIMSVKEVKSQDRFGGVKLEGDRIVGLNPQIQRQGPVLINAGLYVFRKDLLKRLAMPESFSLENEIFLHPRSLDIRAHICNGTFLDIGTPEDYQRAQTMIPNWVKNS